MHKRSAAFARLYLSLEPIPMSSEPGPSEPPYGAGTTWEERYSWAENYVRLDTLQASLPENNAILVGLLELMKSGEKAGVAIDPIAIGGSLEQVTGLMVQAQIPYFIQDIHDDPNGPNAGDGYYDYDYLVTRHLAVIFDGAETIEEKHQEIAKISLQALMDLRFDHASWIPF